LSLIFVNLGLMEKAAIRLEKSNRRVSDKPRQLAALSASSAQFYVENKTVSCVLRNMILVTIGRAHTTGENGEWGETKQSSENQVAFNSVLGPS
jgi:hypothetical protein